jgi:hypothetical protein
VKTPDSGGSAFASACAASSFGVPLFVVASRLCTSGHSFDDLQLVRGLGMVPVGGQGVISSLLARLAALLPIGGQPERAGFLGAIVLGVVGFLCFSIARRLLEGAGSGPGLAALLGASAALSATLSPAAQMQAAALDPVVLSTTFALAAIALGSGGLTSARQWLAIGMFAALAMVENLGVGLTFLVIVALQAILCGTLPSRRALALCVAGLVAVGGLCLLVVAVRARTVGSWLTLGAGMSTLDTPTALVTPTLHAWLDGAGPVALTLGVIGMLYGLTECRLRPVTLVLALCVSIDALLCWLQAADANDHRVLALAAVSMLATLGVRVGLMALEQLRLPFSEPVSVLLVVFQMTLACTAIEESKPTARNAAANETWTDETLGRLPAKSLLLVRDPNMAWRAWAARIVRGERPDVVVVPLTLLSYPELLGSLLAAEPSLAALIRDVSVNGSPTEHGLAQVADSRPLFVDLDPRWDQRLLAHLLPEGMWLRYSSHPMGRSDRARGLVQAQLATARMTRSFAPGMSDMDAPLRALFGRRLKEQAALLASLGDKASAASSLNDLARVLPEDAFLRELRQHLNQDKPASLSVVVSLLN